MSAAGLFPSRTVSLYMARMFLIRTFAILFMLVLILQSLDLLSESGRILTYPGNGEAEILRYISLRTPQIIETFLPFSVLLGTILTLSQLNQNSEVIALKGLGLSAHQVLAPLMLAALGVAIVSFAFNDRIVSRATATLDQWKKVEYAPLPIDRGDRGNVWVRQGSELIQVRQARGRGDGAELFGITIFDREGTMLRAVTTADRAVRDGDGWRSADVRRFDIASGRVTLLGNARIAEGIRPDQFMLVNVNASGLSFGELWRTIEDLKANGRPTKSLEGAMWHKISGPLSAVLMPLLGAVAAFGIARSGKLFVRAVLGMALGFAYFVADNFALAMGNLGAYPPLLAAWSPFFLFLMIGEAVLIRSEE